MSAHDPDDAEVDVDVDVEGATPPEEPDGVETPPGKPDGARAEDATPVDGAISERSAEPAPAEYDDVPAADAPAEPDDVPTAGAPLEPDVVAADARAADEADPLPATEGVARPEDAAPPPGGLGTGERGAATTPEGARHAQGASSHAPGGPAAVSRSWGRIGRALAPRATRAQLTVAVLSTLLGFALVVQVQQNRSEGLASLRQDELVRILDEVTQRSEELEDEAAVLRAQRAELVTGTDTERAAREAAEQRAQVQGILAGQLPATGPGVLLTIGAPGDPLPALTLYNVLEELRNAGAEAVQLNDLRLTASSYVVDGGDGVVVDGTTIGPPFRWRAIGDPDTIIPALNMPGGAMAQVRNAGGTVDLRAADRVDVDATRELSSPRYATPAPVPEDG